MANYTREKSKYGGVVGSIQIFTSSLPLANDPLDAQWKSKIPAGFLRCDGSVLNSAEYPELAAILGVGDASKFKKESQELNENQFQLPDLGSKYMTPGLASGQYASLNIIQTGKNRVGAEVSVTSNVGNSVTIDYSGNFTVIEQSDLALLGNSKFKPPNEEKNTEEATLDASSFQAHGHNTNAKVLNYTGNFKVGAEGKSGTDLTPFAGNQIVGSGNPSNTDQSVHKHGISWPAAADYDQNFVYQFDTFNAPADNLQTTINISTKTVTELPETVQPFILVEYIIKF